MTDEAPGDELKVLIVRSWMEPAAVGKRQLRRQLIRLADEYYILSQADEQAIGEEETLAFPADSDGNVLNWLAVAGGAGYTFSSAIRELELLVEMRLGGIRIMRESPEE